MRDIIKILGVPIDNATLDEFADILVARDEVSLYYLTSEIIKKDKVLLYPDFTASVKGVETEYSKKHKNKICVIPNSKIIQTGVMDYESYQKAIVKIIDHICKNGYKVVLLNHEGLGDYNLCKSIASQTNDEVAIVTGLNAVETKGVIASSYMVISSRFHGVANALSSCVPCLATSWSHKYQKLLDEYEQYDNLLDLTDIDKAYSMVDRMLVTTQNDKIRSVLKAKNEIVKAKNLEMWNTIWEMINK